MSNLFRELKIAVRYLMKSPGFALTAVLMLALGIGATTAIFSIVEGVLLRPLPFPQPERLVILGDIIQGAEVGGFNGTIVTVQDILNYTRDTHSFSSLGGYQPSGYELSGTGQPAMIQAARLSGGVFPTLGVQPMIGRFFTRQEDEQPSSDGIELCDVEEPFRWRLQHCRQKVLLDRKPYVVIGVMPRNFEFRLIRGV